ncbi:BppU family phage baseplate upper protein [Bacillus sp. RC250]|uniref:BppU family phage baseplate upper protein n=1 Tax=Bacillus sp. RC250 TaxID=3156287 RepID=UPI0038348931
MTFKTRELTVDLVDEISTKEIRFSQGDKNSAKLVLNITNQGEELDLSKAIAVRITFRKPDGTTVFQEDLQPINAMKGKYQIILKTQTLAAAGNVYGQVRIFEKDQELDAEPFGFTVKQSYSGNGAVESTNEFTIIQKAIEAGEKLKGVDIDGIIAAGAKADAALPKAGGTMTGKLRLKHVTGDAQRIEFQGKTTADNAEPKIDIASDGETYIGAYYRPTGRRIWRYTSADDTFTVDAANTNLLKKTGDTMTGELTMAVDKNISFKTGDYEFKHRAQAGNTKLIMQSVHPTEGNKFVWEYRGDNNTFTMNADTNLVKSTGGYLTGSLYMDVSTSNRSYGWKRADGKLHYFYGGADVIALFSEASNKTAWQYNPSTDTFIVNSNFKTAKDGRANLTLTADAELISANGVIADRRGNTVTLRAPIRRKAGVASTTTLLVMPADMRPLITIQQGVISTDGSSAIFTIQADGSVSIQDIGTPVAGKNFFVTCTYVVD